MKITVTGYNSTVTVRTVGESIQVCCESVDDAKTSVTIAEVSPATARVLASALIEAAKKAGSRR